MDDGLDSPPAPITTEETPPEAAISEAPKRESPTLETALTWLAKVKPAAILVLLRDPDFALISMTAFAGFRVNATGYANPLVRRRLAQEVLRDEKFADKMQALAEDPLSGFATFPSEGEKGQERNAVAAPREAELTAPTERRLETMRAERDRRRRERDEARQALAASEDARQDAERRRHQAEAEREEAHQQAQRQAQRIARLERQVAKLQVEQTSLLRALKQREEEGQKEEGRGDPAPTSETDTPVGAGSPRPSSFPRPSSSRPSRSPHPSSSVQNDSPPPNLWLAAVAHLLDKRRFDLALSLAEDVLRADPDNPDALDIAAQAQGAKGETREAAALLRRRLTVTTARGEAAEVLLRLLLLNPSDHERDLRAFLGGLRADDAPALEQARTMLARLRGLAPETHAAVALALGRLAPAALTEALMPPPGQIGPDDPLPLGMAGNISARQLLQAVDTGHVALVEGVRAALARLGHRDPETWERVRQALERASSNDPSSLVPLLGTRERGPVVVDGSNAAWFDQESLAAGRPRLQALIGLRRALRARGYFPVLLYADAPLPYTVDEPDALRAMVGHGEISLVDSGVDADEVLLREAKRFRAPLVTNDYMMDWDPNNEVPKIRYTLSLNGEAYLLNE